MLDHLQGALVRGVRWLLVLAAFSITVPVSAAETILYAYDALGRLVAVQQTDGPLAGTNTAYGFDQADNRQNVTVTGAPNLAPHTVIVVPLNGLTVIVLN